jgi:heat shock protein HslJ
LRTCNVHRHSAGSPWENVFASIGFTALPAAAQSDPNRYRADAAPGWWLRIDGGWIALHERPPHGGARVVRPKPHVTLTSVRYTTPKLVIEIRHRRCALPGAPFARRDTVRVLREGRVLTGCGGPVIPPGAPVASLSGSWRIVEAEGVATPANIDAHIRFDSGRIGGNASCNALAGSFTHRRGTLKTSLARAAGRMCDTRIENTQDDRVRTALEKPLAVRRGGERRLILTDRDGLAIVLERDSRR